MVRGAKGLTLIELLVVLLLMALSAALVAPRLGRLLPPEKRGFVSELQTLLEEARRKAILSGRVHLLVIDPGRREIFLAEEENSEVKKKLPIPETLEIKGLGLCRRGDRRMIIFYPNGLSSGGEIELNFTDTNERYLLKIAGLLPYVERVGPPEADTYPDRP